MPATGAIAGDERWDSQFGAPSEIASTNILDGANGPINVVVRDIRFFLETRVYVAGSFTRIGDIEANNVAFWDGESWHSIGEGTNNGVSGEVKALVIGDHRSEIIVGGDFDRAGGNPANHIARWDGTNWSALGGVSTGGCSLSGC
jgi:hypothetical protein